MHTYRAKQDVPVHNHACPVPGAPDRLAGSFRLTPFRAGAGGWRRRRLSQVPRLECAFKSRCSASRRSQRGLGSPAEGPLGSSASSSSSSSSRDTVCLARTKAGVGSDSASDTGQSNGKEGSSSRANTKGSNKLQDLDVRRSLPPDFSWSWQSERQVQADDAREGRLARSRASLRGRGRGRSAPPARGRSYIPEDDPKDRRAARAWNEVNVVIDTRDEEKALITEGYWQDLLKEKGVLDIGAGSQLRQGQYRTVRHVKVRSGFLVNRLLSQVDRWESVFTVFRDLEPLFDHINLSTALHRLARTSYKHRAPLAKLKAHPDFNRLMARLKTHIQGDRLFPRQLANTLWALAKMGLNEDEYIEAVFEQMQRSDMKEWQEQEMSNMVWAMATLGRERRVLLQHSAAEALRRGFASYAPQAISNLVWGFAQLGYCNEAFLTAAADHSAMGLDEFAPQAVSNIVWGFATMDFYHDKFIEATAADLTRRADEYNEQEISNVILAFGKLEHVDMAVLKACEESIVNGPNGDRSPRLTSQGLTNILWGYATLRYYPHKVLQAVTQELHRRMATLGQQEISVSLWALAKLGFHPGRMLAEFGARIEVIEQEFLPQACSNTLWALAVLQGTQLACFQTLVRRLSELGSEDAAERLMEHQLFQALLLAELEAEKAGAPGVFQMVPADTLQAIRKVWRTTAAQTLNSRFHMDVSEKLHFMGIAHEDEFLTEDGCFSIDIVVSGPKGPVAIEVDGPYHYTVNTLNPLGSTLIRRRLLTGRGWLVLSVPFYEYYELGSVKAKMVYLAQILSAVGIDVDPETLQSIQDEPLETMSITPPQGRISALEGPQRATDLDNARLYARASMGKPASEEPTSGRSSSSAADQPARRPSGGRLMGAPRRNPLSMQRLPALAEGSAAAGASSTNSSPLSNTQSGQHLAEPEEDAWEHILPAASANPRRKQHGPDRMASPDRSRVQGEAELEGSSGQPRSSSYGLPRQPQQPGYQQQRSSSGASAAPAGAPGMTQEQRDGRAAFVARTNEQMAQAAASPAAGSQAQSSGNGAGQQGSSVLEARRRRLLAMRMTELRPLCKEQSIPMHGSKAVIVERLLASTQ